MERGIQVGDVVRLYGYPGTFVAEVRRERETSLWDMGVSRDGRYLFGTMAASVVEINGQPVPMLSCPVAPPAADYPHEPRFDYVDGPAVNAEWAIEAWYRLQNGEVGVCDR